MPNSLGNVADHARQRLQPPSGELPKDRGELISLYRKFLKIEEHRIRLRHHAGGDGFTVATKRAELLDIVLSCLFTNALASLSEEARKTDSPPVTLVATGGYGRSLLNPCSDVDLLFLVPAGSSLSEETTELIEQIICMLWDVGFKLGHAVRTIRESIHQANQDDKTKTSMIEARLVIGDEALFQRFQERFAKQCIGKHKRAFLEQRIHSVKERREKYGTVYLQEPNVKQGCGGLRDYHNLVWITFVEFGTTDLNILAKKRILEKGDLREIERAYHFLLRVRNELHYHTGRDTDILTLQLQGVVATNFQYPSRNILRRVEAFMRDYYQHTRNLSRQTWRVLERLHLTQSEEDEHGIVNFLALRRKKREYFGSFYSWNGYIYPKDATILDEAPHRIMRLFQNAQQRHLSLSPQAMELLRNNFHLINKEFRYNKKVRLIFEAILSRRGNVARVLKQMHRAGVLGRYLPEFGALDCLVQHEFFHRYTADHHTLMCIFKLDELADTTNPKLSFYRDLFHAVEDPYPLYVAFIMHDTGRAENVRFHSDASATLAARVCRRLQIRGERRRIILFLVDHHLTFWRTATTMPIDEPKTIAQFAGQMRDKRNLDLLFLFTYADSKGTYEDAWSEWKEMLMKQLYRSTLLYWEDHKAIEVKGEDLRPGVEKELGAEYAEDISTHFQGMPERYFHFRAPKNICRDIRLIRNYLQSCGKRDDCPNMPAFRWVDHDEANYSDFIVCGKDQPLLLARIAGVLASHNINILSADLFRRSDEIVLDLFRVCTTNFEAVTLPSVRQSVMKLMEEAFVGNTFDFTAMIAKARKKSVIHTQEAIAFPQRVHVSNQFNDDATVIEIQAVDRLGLLHDCFTSIGALNLEITHARIITEKGAAIDTLYVTTADGKKLADPEALKALAKRLNDVIGIRDEAKADTD